MGTKYSWSSVAKNPQETALNFHAKLKNSYFLTRKSSGFVAAVPPVAAVFDEPQRHDTIHTLIKPLLN
jgi:hypothetical protein